jgi:sec-independent protein translocase protein TatB
MASEFRRSFDEMARESELAELRKEIEDLKKNNPVADLANSLTGVQADVSLEGGGVAAEPAPSIPAEPRSGEFQVTESNPAPAHEPQPASGTTS